jgi:hypothetical protein
MECTTKKQGFKVSEFRGFGAREIAPFYFAWGGSGLRENEYSAISPGLVIDLESSGAEAPGYWQPFLTGQGSFRSQILVTR